MHPAHRRRGVATDAVATVLRYAFGDLRLSRLELVHDVGNPASCTVATRSGFSLEGVERAAMGYPDGRVSDQHRHARIAGDPPGPAAPPRPLEPVSLDAGHLLLRPWQPGDADDVLHGLSNPLVVRWNPRLPLRDLPAAAAWIGRRAQSWADGRAASWAVVEDHRVVGSVALRDLNTVDAFAVASYWTMPAARGRGVAVAALARATSYAFDGLGLHRVQLAHAVANAASCRVAEKTGFRLEGTLRQSNRLTDGFSDEHWHARLVTDG